jgi:glycopeptide antibiotics resistance protein
VFDEVPVLPVVVPLAAVVLAILVWQLRRRRLLTASRAAVAVAVCVYVAGVVANTVFPIFLDKPAYTARWTEFVNLTLLSGYEVVDAVTNICVFVPVGLLVPLVAPTFSWRRALVAATTFSLLIEVTQYVTAHLLGGGHVADVNDLLFNVVGAALGLLLSAALAQVPLGAHAIRRLRWS